MFKNTPSKFGKGIGLLWRGMELSTLNKIIKDSMIFKKSEHERNIDQNILLFESARTALYNCLCAQNIGIGDEVIVSAFTCEAVTYGVKKTGANVIYVDINEDLTMNDNNVINAINSNTKAVILQNTFGRLGLKLSTIKTLQSKSIFIVGDCALAIGSRCNDKSISLYGDVSFWSLEVSKTVTLGWGGVLYLNNEFYAEKIKNRYNSIKHVPRILDFRRIMQLWCSVFLTKFKLPCAFLFWYFMYGIRLFRKSNNFTNYPGRGYEKMGKLSKLLFLNLYSSLNDFFKKTNHNYKFLLETGIKLDLNCLIVEKDDEYIVTPRIPFLVKNEDIPNIISFGKDKKIEIGRWFSEVPPKWGVSDCKIHAMTNAKKISKGIINLPCYWTLNKKELKQLVDLMKYISSLK